MGQSACTTSIERYNVELINNVLYNKEYTSDDSFDLQTSAINLYLRTSTAYCMLTIPYTYHQEMNVISVCVLTKCVILISHIFS